MNNEKEKKNEEIQEENLPEDMTLESLLLRQRVWKTYRIAPGLNVIIQNLIAKELSEITPAAAISANDYMIRYIAYSIRQLGDEDWSNLDFNTRLEKVKNLAVPIVEKLMDIVVDFRNKCEELLKEDIKKK